MLGTATVTVQLCVWSFEEPGKGNEAGEVVTHAPGRGFPPVPFTRTDIVRASLFFGSVTLCEKEPLFPTVIVKDAVAGL